jgi:hypothetical protein
MSHSCVRGKFDLSVVYLTTDAMTSGCRGRRQALAGSDEELVPASLSQAGQGVAGGSFAEC